MRKYWLVACSALVAPAAVAAENVNDGWTITLKGNAVASPAFEGANHESFIAYPSLSVRRAGTEASFSAPDDGIGFALYDAGWLKAGPVARFKGARKAADHSELIGLRDVDWTVEGGVFVEVWPLQQLRGRVEIRRGFHGHTGVVADLGADWVERRGPWTLSIGPRLTLANTHFMNSYFSVSPAESLLNGRLPAFAASGGAKSAGLAGAVTYAFSPQWSLTGSARWDRLIGDAGASPIPRIAGSRNQFTFGATLGYSFDIAKIGVFGL